MPCLSAPRLSRASGLTERSSRHRGTGPLATEPMVPSCEVSDLQERASLTKLEGIATLGEALDGLGQELARLLIQIAPSQDPRVAQGRAQLQGPRPLSAGSCHRGAKPLRPRRG